MWGTQPNGLSRLGIVEAGVVDHRPKYFLHPRSARLGETHYKDIIGFKLLKSRG